MYQEMLNPVSVYPCGGSYRSVSGPFSGCGFAVRLDRGGWAEDGETPGIAFYSRDGAVEPVGFGVRGEDFDVEEGDDGGLL